MPQSIVHIENLVKRYGDLTALNHLDLDIREGEIFGLLGPNGSGKTTAISCLLSLLKYDRGQVEIFGEEMKPDNYKVKEQIGIVLQNVAVFEEPSHKRQEDEKRAGGRSYRVYRPGGFPKDASEEAFRRPSAPAEYCLRDCPQTKADHHG